MALAAAWAAAAWAAWAAWTFNQRPYRSKRQEGRGAIPGFFFLKYVSALTRVVLVTYICGVDALFDALADPTRRAMLDALRIHDGQTQGDLAKPFAMTRFGVMRHLAVLEAAGLVATRKVGREKFHYLNPVPLQRLLDRWMSRYAEPFARGMVDLKDELEAKEMNMKPPAQVYEIYIRSTPEAVWDAITNPERTVLWFRGSRAVSDWLPGSPTRQVNPDGSTMIYGTVLEAEPPHRLAMTFNGGQASFAGDPETRITYEISAVDGLTKLRAIHDGFETRNATYEAVSGGWPLHLSAIKTLLETGEPLKQAA